MKELNQKLNDKKEALRKFRFEMTGGKIKDVKTGKNLRKEIARMLTEIKQNNE